MDVNKRVEIRADFILEKFGNEITVYHPVSTTSLYLNESGAVIWELCSQGKRIGEIIAVLEAAFPESREQITGDVIGVVTQLIERDFATLRD